MKIHVMDKLGHPPGVRYAGQGARGSLDHLLPTIQPV